MQMGGVHFGCCIAVLSLLIRDVTCNCNAMWCLEITSVSENMDWWRSREDVRCELIRQVVTEFGSSGLGLTPAAEQTGAESAQLCATLM